MNDKVIFGAVVGVGLVVAGVLWLKSSAVAHEGRKAPASGLGDIDGDGWVTNADLDLAEQCVANPTSFTAEELRRADVNKDGNLNALDITLIELYMLGKADF